jgi:hypothetical protein
MITNNTKHVHAKDQIYQLIDQGSEPATVPICIRLRTFMPAVRV